MRLLIKISIISVGIIAILAALPIGAIAELSISGCCGGPTTGREGQGLFIGGVVAVVGIIMVISGIKYNHNPKN